MTSLFRAVLLLTLTASIALAGNGRDMAREAEIEATLTRLNPALVQPFREARIAYDKSDYKTAAGLLAPICGQLPKFDPAFRRLGACLRFLGNQAQAIQYCEQAVAINRSAPNLVTLAYVLSAPKTGDSTMAQKKRALGLVLECRSLPDGDDEDALTLTAQLALQVQDLAEARTAVSLLQTRFPNTLAAHYFAALIAANDEHWVTAEREIKRAEKFGLSAEATQSFLDSGIQSRATSWKFIGGTALAIGAWATGLLILFASGYLLSKLTLRQAASADVTAAISVSERRLRRVYRTILNVAGVYYYISLPIVMVLVVGICGGICYGFLLIGTIPIKLTLLLIIGAIATIWTMGRSLFIRVKHTDPGRPLARTEAEALWQLTDEVAQTINTRPIDEIRITEGTDLAVYERGNWREKLENKASRILILGTAVLDGFKQDDFRSVLAHEYGHFAHRDTAGGDVAMRVRNDMIKFYYAMVEAGQATKLNVAFHFLRLYNFIFRRISHGATRLQEILADRVAAQTYGRVAFEGGLRHVIRQSILFGNRADQEINSAIKAGRPIQNLYQPHSTEEAVPHDEFEKAINRPTTEDDTHPGPLDRFRMIASVPMPARASSNGLVWELFSDRAAIEAEMMAKIEKNVAKHRG